MSDSQDERRNIPDTSLGRISGKVARILNRRQLVINRGDNDGVKVGMQFAVLNDVGSDITDPDTGELLGSTPIPKVIVKVVRVEPRLSVASTFRRYRIPGGPLAEIARIGIGDLTRKPEVVIETLSTDDSTFKQELKDKDLFVHIGDKVSEIKEGDEFAGWEPGAAIVDYD